MDTYIHEDVETYKVETTAGSVTSTAEHPFYVQGKGWIPVRDLTPGDALVDPKGSDVAVVAVVATGEAASVYNFHVEELHTYHVQVDARPTWLRVHNECGEKFYRTMSPEHYDELVRTGRVPVTGETFVSPTRGFSEAYDGRLVEFTTHGGTTERLAGVGVRDTSRATRAAYPDMPVVSKGWAEQSALFKAEGDQINIGLGHGQGLDTFNGGPLRVGAEIMIMEGPKTVPHARVELLTDVS